jgi:hypothetical protein
MWKIASLEPSVGTTSRARVQRAPKRRRDQPAIASRSSGRPSASG